LAASRSVRPVIPLPDGVPAGLPTPSSTISTDVGVSRTVQRLAPLCRMVFVTPSRTT